jgi:hypothetical protein
MQIRRWPTCSLHVLFRFFSTPMRCFRKKDFAQEVSKPIWGFQAFPKRLIEKCHSLWKMWTNVDFSNNHMKRAGFHSKKNLVDGTNGANVKTNWVVHANIGPVILTYVYKCHYMRIDQYPPKYVWVWKYDKICTIIPFSPYEQDGIPPRIISAVPCALRLGCADFRRAVPGGWCPLAARNTMGKNEGFNTFHIVSPQYL